jgi:hypothetical protein
MFFGAEAFNWLAAADANSRFRLVMVVLGILLLSLRENASGHSCIIASGNSFRGGGEEKKAARN